MSEIESSNNEFKFHDDDSELPETIVYITPEEDRLRAQVQDLRRERDVGQKMYDTALETVGDLQKENTRLRKELARVQAHLDKMWKERDKIERMLAESGKTVHRLKARCAELEGALRVVKESVVNIRIWATDKKKDFIAGYCDQITETIAQKALEED